jgi:hypothetical protein
MALIFLETSLSILLKNKQRIKRIIIRITVLESKKFLNNLIIFIYYNSTLEYLIIFTRVYYFTIYIDYIINLILYLLRYKNGLP